MSILLVPVQLDAFCAATDTEVVGPSADFSRLPYVDPATGLDVGPGVPLVGEILLPTPFEYGAWLQAGVHLHWSLPDALTRLLETGEDSTFPPVPDRWLVTRTRNGTVERQWVVESDHLSDTDAGGVAFPVVPDDRIGDPGSGRPYRFLGRAVPLERWDPAGGTDDRLQPRLTAVGHGEPTFAAFYPNCRGVFGLHDPEVAGVPQDGVGYDVLGWFGDAADRDELAAVYATSDGGWTAALADSMGWKADGADRPTRMVCAGRLAFGTDPAGAPSGSRETTGVWLADTATEALAAHLGHVVANTTPEQAEALLEGIAYADEMEQATADLPMRLATARQQAAFTSSAGGTYWTVRRQDMPGVDPVLAREQAAVPLPVELDAALAELNERQSALDRATATLTGLRQRLFTDWCRYLLCSYRPDGIRDSYPDPDEVADLLRREVDRVTDLAAQLVEAPDTLAGRLAAARDEVHRLCTRVTGAMRQVASKALGGRLDVHRVASTFVLEARPARPFHRPNDPVVLLTGTAARPSDRYGADRADGHLPCAVLPGDDDGLATAKGVVELRERASGEKVVADGERHWRQPPWHPVLLQWEVEFFRTDDGDAGGDLAAGDRDYGEAFLTGRYAVAADDVDLRPRPGRATPVTAPDVYTGSTVLSRRAGPVLSDRVLRYLEGALLGPAVSGIATEAIAHRPTGGAPAFRAAPDGVLGWYLDNNDGTDGQLLTLIRVYRHLADNERLFLAQSLGGFDDALLMLRLARQLPVADPLGFPSGRRLAEQVAAAVLGENRHAPQPLNDFNPIRAGELHVRRLRIVDSFGVPYDVPIGEDGPGVGASTSGVRTTTGLRSGNRPDRAALPPRLAQPARLTVTLTDARFDRRPVTCLPTSSPVCGWLVPELLDVGVRVHAADGGVLGRLSGVGSPVWGTAPGAARRSSGDVGSDVENVHLRRVVENVAAIDPDHRGGDPGRVSTFLEAVDTAQGRIVPEGPVGRTVRTVITGSPLAVVRLSIELELLGPPAPDQDWNAFRGDMAGGGTPRTRGFERVRIPVRVGEHHRLGDGLVGFWEEDPSGGLGEFRDVAGQDEDVVVLTVTPGGGPIRLTALLDPHAAVHVTTGVLPVQTFRVATEHYQHLIDDLGVGFLAAPVLADAGEPASPLPAEPGADWFWEHLDGTRVRAPAASAADTFLATPTLHEEWLTLTQEGT